MGPAWWLVSTYLGINTSKVTNIPLCETREQHHGAQTLLPNIGIHHGCTNEGNEAQRNGEEHVSQNRSRSRQKKDVPLLLFSHVSNWRYHRDRGCPLDSRGWWQGCHKKRQSVQCVAHSDPIATAPKSEPGKLDRWLLSPRLYPASRIRPPTQSCIQTVAGESPNSSHSRTTRSFSQWVGSTTTLDKSCKARRNFPTELLCTEVPTNWGRTTNGLPVSLCCHE